MSNNITFEEKSIDYEKSLDGDFKKNNGIFYTDTELASSIVKFLKIPEKASILDPCCGTGSFIYALQQKGYSKVYGCDFDLMTVKKCRELTESKKIKTMDTIGQSGDIVLKKMRHSKFDYIIGNPPYAPLGKNVSIEGDAHFVAKVKSAGSNLFVAAIYRAFELAKTDGIISFIIPKNLLHISSYKNIRETLLKEKTIISIIELGIHFKTVRGEQVVLTVKNNYEENNKIKFYSYNHGKITFMSDVAQNYYEDEIIVFTDNEEDVPDDGNQIFIQNIFSAEAGITASFGGNLKPSETVTTIKLKNTKMCKYVLGLLHSRVCNYFLIRFGFNNSRLTIHTDAQYLKGIPIVIDDDAFEKVVSIVNKMEAVTYMDDEWYKLNEQLNDIVYKIYELNVNDKNYIEKEMKKISASKWYGKTTCTA